MLGGEGFQFSHARARPRRPGRYFNSKALTQLTQISPWPQDTRTHHGITAASSRIPDLAGWRWQASRPRKSLLQLFAGTFTHTQARQALCGSLAAVKGLIEAPVASRDASTTLPGLYRLAQPVGRRGASFGCATLKDPPLRPVDLSLASWSFFL